MVHYTASLYYFILNECAMNKVIWRCFDIYLEMGKTRGYDCLTDVRFCYYLFFLNGA